MAQMVDRMEIRTPRGSLSEFNYRITPYGGGSDHMMFIDRKIPGMMFSHDPDYTHHTSEDTPDKVDPVELERCEIISTAAVLYLANLQPGEAASLIYCVRGNSSHRLGLAARRAHQLIASSAGGRLFTAWIEATNILEHVQQGETAAVSSVLQFASDENLQDLVTSTTGVLSQLNDAYLQDLRAFLTTRGFDSMDGAFAQPPRDDRVPIRLTRGPLDFGLPASRLSSPEAAWYRSKEFTLNGDMRFELVNFIDGNRSVSQVRNALSAEFSPVELRSVSRYIEDLVKVGVLKWK
jgi:hypothetical protein